MSQTISSPRDRRDTALGALDATVPPTSRHDGLPLVLLVHDTPRLESALGLLLADEGFTVEAVPADGDLGPAVRRLEPDLLLLHVAGSEARAVSLLTELRELGDQPLLVLTPRNSAEIRVRSLELGADDYLATPFDPDELAARLRAVLRRGERSTSHVPPLVLGPLVVDFERRILTRDGTLVSLGRTEWLVLRYLARHQGKVVLNTELLRAIWGDGYSDDLQVLRICISRLRQKLGSSSRGGGPIRTFHNVGYSLEPEASG